MEQLDPAHGQISDAILDQLDYLMNLAAEEGAKGPAFGSNPQVGCVIVNDAGAVLSTGYHRGTGTPHAEIDALSTLRPEQTHGATALVTLEPCNHTGHTGPCVDALLQAGIRAVVFAEIDPGTASGKGANRLAQNGVITLHHPTQNTSRLNHRWLTSMRNQRPYTILKWASTIDGRIAAADGTSQWITGLEARNDAHQNRQRVDAMIIGTGTALADNPSLTARDHKGELFAHQPIPVVVGNRDLPDDALLRSHPRPLQQFRTHDLEHVLQDLFTQGIRSVIVEGGAALLSSFLQHRLVDELHIYLAPKLLGGPRTVLQDIGVNTIADAPLFRLEEVQQFGADIFVAYVPDRVPS